MNFLTPYPLVQELPAPLVLAVKIESPSGWIDLEDPPGYAIEASSFAEAAVTWRKQEVSNNWVDGTFVVSAVKDNVTESLSVWIRGATQYEYTQRRDALLEALSQLSYRLMVRFDDVATYWTCSPADWSVKTQREFLHARIGLVTASVPHNPNVEILLATGDEL